MTTKEPTIELVRTGSHYITLPGGGNRFKEEVYCYFQTEWRGTPVAVTMGASRSELGDRSWGDWRIIVNEANEGTRDQRGRELTATAKHRMHELLAPLVVEWLASDAYTVSESEAYFDALRREIGSSRPSSDDPTSMFRRYWEQSKAKLTPAQSARLIRMADAYNAFAAIYNGTDED